MLMEVYIRGTWITTCCSKLLLLHVKRRIHHQPVHVHLLVCCYESQCASKLYFDAHVHACTSTFLCERVCIQTLSGPAVHQCTCMFIYTPHVSVTISAAATTSSAVPLSIEIRYILSAFACTCTMRITGYKPIKFTPSSPKGSHCAPGNASTNCMLVLQCRSAGHVKRLIVEYLYWKRDWLRPINWVKTWVFWAWGDEKLRQFGNVTLEG